MQQVFDGLVSYDASLALVPAIAHTWRLSEDGLIWTFQVRKGVRFHHGREVTAEDFVYSLRRLLDLKSKSRARDVLTRVAGASEYTAGRVPFVAGLKAPARYVLEIHLTEPTPALISALALVDAMVVAREVVERLGDKFGEQPVGAGPFRFVRWIKGKEIVLEANPDYFVARPYLDRIEFKIFPGAPFALILSQFESGLLEDSFLPAKDVARFAGHQTYQFVRRPVLRLRFLGVNVTARPLDNVKVRQALNYAIDQETVSREVHKERYPPAFGILPPGMAGYDPKSRLYAYDPAKAKALLAEAGYPGGRGLPALEMWSSVKTPETLREDERLVRYLADIGIVAEVKYNTDFPAFRAQIAEGKLPIFRYGWVADIPDPDYFLFDLFSSQSPKNLFHYRNREVDLLLQRARAERDFSRRVAWYREAHVRILEHAPVIPLTFGSYERVFQPYVRNISVNALGDLNMPMDRIWLDLPAGVVKAK
jgi:peptide/nickel transport system substrate-binding protein/oligopeptide transport system substrate-binding protein